MIKAILRFLLEVTMPALFSFRSFSCPAVTNVPATGVGGNEVQNVFSFPLDENGKLLIDDDFLKRLFSLPWYDRCIQLPRFLALDWGMDEDTGVVPHMVFLYGDRLRPDLIPALENPSPVVKKHAAKLLGYTGNPADDVWARKQGARFPNVTIVDELRDEVLRKSVQFLKNGSEDFGSEIVYEGEVKNLAGNGFLSTVTFIGIHEGRTYGRCLNLYFRKEKVMWKFTHYFQCMVW
ncbi:MAG: hypothetical protein IKR48_09315 [Kiritimatiellae bacterium]|nr:hypothetical protein [Kiritimatiellia bacterium]